MWSFKKREPVYSDVGRELYVLLIRKEQEWESKGLSELYHRPTGITIRSYALWNQGWFGVGCTFGVCVLDPEGLPYTLLTADDQDRLYKALLLIVDQREHSRQVMERERGNKGISVLLGLTKDTQ